MRPVVQDACPENRDAPAIYQRVGVRGRAKAHTKGNGVTYTLVPVRPPEAQNFLFGSRSKIWPIHRHLLYMATSTTVSHAEETDVGVIFTTQPPPNRSRWTTEASDPKIFTYLNTTPLNMPPMKTSAFTDGKHEACFENILSAAWQSLSFTLTSTLAALRRLPRRVHDMNTGLQTSVFVQTLRPCS